MANLEFLSLEVYTLLSRQSLIMSTYVNGTHVRQLVLKNIKQFGWHL